MTAIVMNVFLRLENLQVLSLQGNPLTFIVRGASHSQEHALIKLDLSRTRLRVFDSNVVRNFPKLQLINISFSSLEFVESNIFQNLSNLKSLDIRSNRAYTFPADLLQGSHKLSLVRSTDYRLCCKDVLPDVSPPTKCFAPQHVLSSCETMIRSEVFLLELWCVAVFGTVGNVVCCAGYCAVKTIPYISRFIIFMINLHCTNFCTGIYTLVVAAAHETFRGQYIHHEDRWKDSAVCRGAGFLSILSSEVSVLVIFLLTLDHLIVFCYPLSNSRFTCRSTVLACAVTWVVGLLLASVPLIPGLSHWGYYGQTALCSLTLHDRPHLGLGFRFFHVVLASNCLICLTASVALVIVYRAMPKHRLLIDSSKNPEHTSVDLILRIAFTDVLGWFSVAFVSFLAVNGVAGKDNSNVVIAAMVLPANSAVNPLLCLWHNLSYTRRQKREERLLHVLNSRIKPIPARNANKL